MCSKDTAIGKDKNTVWQIFTLHIEIVLLKNEKMTKLSSTVLCNNDILKCRALWEKGNGECVKVEEREKQCVLLLTHVRT